MLSPHHVSLVQDEMVQEATSPYTFLQEIPWGKKFPISLCFSHQLSDLVQRVVRGHLVGHRCGSCHRECSISLVAFIPKVCKTKVGLGYLNPLSWDIWPLPAAFSLLCSVLLFAHWSIVIMCHWFLIIKCWKRLQLCLFLIIFHLYHFVLFYPSATFIFFLFFSCEFPLSKCCLTYQCSVCSQQYYLDILCSLQTLPLWSPDWCPCCLLPCCAWQTTAKLQLGAWFKFNTMLIRYSFTLAASPTLYSLLPFFFFCSYCEPER